MTVYLSARIDPPLHMGNGWEAGLLSRVDGSRIVTVYLTHQGEDLEGNLRFDPDALLFLDSDPRFRKRFRKAARVKLAAAVEAAAWLGGAGTALDEMAAEVRGWLLRRMPLLESLAGPAPTEAEKPTVVREVEEILRSRAFGCYTDKVAELCGKLIGHKVSHKAEKPRNWPPGSFLVVRADMSTALSSGFRQGEVVVAIEGTRGFGRNIFSSGTGMRPDGTVWGGLDTGTARPASADEIRSYLDRAVPRAMVVVMEILEDRRAA